MEQSEFDYERVPDYNQQSTLPYQWAHQHPQSARKLTEKGWIGKDDAYRWFQDHWIDPATGLLVKRHIFFQFVRETIEIQRSDHKQPRLRAETLRYDWARVYVVYGQKPKEYDIPRKRVRTTSPPRPGVDPYAPTFPHIRLTPKGIQALIEKWPEWINSSDRSDEHARTTY